MARRTVAGGTQGDKASAEAWQGASDRMQTRSGHHLDDWLQEKCAYLKPTMTTVALHRTRGASRIKNHPQPVRSTRSKPGLSECRLVAVIERANSQVMPVTCSRAAAVDGSAIARGRRRRKN